MAFPCINTIKGPAILVSLSRFSPFLLVYHQRSHTPALTTPRTSSRSSCGRIQPFLLAASHTLSLTQFLTYPSLAMSSATEALALAKSELNNTVNHKIKVFIPCHYDLAQVETCAPFLDRYGGVVFVYDWNVAKETITDYYRRQYPDGWVKVMSFSLRNILTAIRDLDHRLDRYDSNNSGDEGYVSTTASQSNSAHASTMPTATPIRNYGGISSARSSISSIMYEPKKQNQVVFLLTGSMNPDYGAFGLTQKKILNAVKDALPERVCAVNIIGHCMYGCVSCSGIEHRVPLYFTRYFNKTLPYTAEDVRALYINSKSEYTSNNTRAVLVAPSCGGTSMIAQKPIIQLFHRLEQTGHWKFIWKMHPSSLQLDGYDLEDQTGIEQRELENVQFVLKNFTVTQDEHVCLLPFMEAFDVIITDLHSSVPFIATYFTPKIILSYFNDADYGTPERHQEFMDQLNTFVEPEELEELLNTLPEPKGNPAFFHNQYGYVDGKEDLRFGNLAKWPIEQVEPSQSLQYRKVMAELALEWKKIHKEMAATFDDPEGANNALGFPAKFPLFDDGDSLDVPLTLPRALPRDRRANGIELRIMSFNIWNGGLSSGHPIEQTANAILASGADVVGLQECSTVILSSGSRRYMLPELMKHLPGWYYSDQKLLPSSTGPRNPWGIVSKFPIVNTTEKGFGVKIQLNNPRHPEFEPPYLAFSENKYPPIERPHLPFNSSAVQHSANTRFMYLFNCHLYYFPYQPFQLLKIPYDSQPSLDTAEEAIQSCIDARGKEMETVLNEIKQVAEQEPDVPIFLTADLNEPSHLDWTPLSVFAGLQPMTVKWPVSEWAYKAGLVDLWRAYQHLCHFGSGSGSSLPPHGPSNHTDANASIEHEHIHHHDPRNCTNPDSPHGHSDVDDKDPVDFDRIEQQVIERPGFTWSALTSELDGSDHYDRIDYVFGLSRESSPIALKDVAIKMGEEVSRFGEKNDRTFKPWPSDHRAVIATVIV